MSKRIACVLALSVVVVAVLISRLSAATISTITWNTGPSLQHHVASPCYDNGAGTWTVQVGTGYPAYKITVKHQVYSGQWVTQEVRNCSPGTTQNGTWSAWGGLDHDCTNSNVSVSTEIRVERSNNGQWEVDNVRIRDTGHP